MRQFLLLVGFFHACVSFAAESPAEAAIKFCEALRDGKQVAEVTAYSALNPNTGDIKKAKILHQWQQEARTLLPRPFEITEQQRRGDQAAVILSQHDADDGRRFQLSLIACIKRGEKWLACPVFGSFENSMTRYDPTVANDRKALTSWMHSREIHLREQWQKRIREQWLERMKAELAPERLATTPPRALIDGVIDAIRSRNEAALLARIGGFSQETMADWPRMEKRIHQVFTSDSWHQWPWKLLASKHSLIAISAPSETGDETHFDLLVLHPDSLSEEPESLSLTIQRDERGRSRVELPETFWVNAPAEEELGEIMDCDSAEQVALYRSIRSQARASWKNAPIQDPEMLADIIEKSLQQGDFASFWGTGCLSARKGEDLLEMPEILGLWHKLHGAAMGSCLFGRVGFQVHQKHALLALQSYAPAEENPISHHKIWLEKRNKEWFLCDGMPHSPPEELTQWWNDQKKSWSGKMADSIIAQIPQIGGLAPIAPAAEQVRQVFSSWLLTLGHDSIASPLPFCTAFQEERSRQSMLKNLATYVEQHTGQHDVLSVDSHGRWTTISARYLSAPPQSEVSYPLHAFVVTDHGPRLLPQLDVKLSAKENPSREFLNQLALRELKKFLPDAAVAELQFLYDAHHARVKQWRSNAP